MNTEILSQYGIDGKTGITRCLNDEKFYEKVLTMFLHETSFKRAKEAYLANDDRAFFAALHELKGSCGNIALSELYKCVCPLVDLVRDGPGPEAEVKAGFEKAEEAYNIARKGIVLALGITDPEL